MTLANYRVVRRNEPRSGFDEQASQDFAYSIFRKFVTELDLFGDFVGVESFTTEGQQFVGCGLFTTFEDDDGFDEGRNRGSVVATGPIGVSADDSRLQYLGMLIEDFFDVARIDVVGA